MIIVSQDKTEIINFENLTEIYINRNDEEEYYYLRSESVCGLYEDLGKYSTEERAKEVLQEIITRHKNWENMKVGQPSGLCLPVYEMPED